MIDQIAQNLTRELSGLKGFSRRNLYCMKRFHSFYTDQGEIVQQLVAQIPWEENIQQLVGQIPFRISPYELAGRLPEELKGSLPTIEEVEAEFGKKSAG